MLEVKELTAKQFITDSSNEGTQVLLYNDKNINVIVRNQARQSKETRKYIITVKEIIDES